MVKVWKKYIEERNPTELDVDLRAMSSTRIYVDDILPYAVT
jgi:hypothetical protein